MGTDLAEGVELIRGVEEVRREQTARGATDQDGLQG
jgi:hypothetical protein